MKSEFKNLPSGWKVVKLGEIAEKSILKNRNNSIKLVLSNSAINGLVAQNEYFDKDIANKENIQDYYIVHLGDFVYNPRISQNAPTGPINRNMFSKGIVSPLYTVFSVQDETLAKFLAYFFQAIVWQNQVKSVANYGARHDRINIKDNTFFSLKILLPPLAEQEKIAEILSTWDEAINLTINLIENKKQFKKALMQNLLTAKIRFPEFQDEWKTPRLKKISSRITRKNQDNKCQNVLTISAQSGLVSQTDFFNKQVASKDLSSYILLKKGDFAYNKSYSAGYSFGAFKRLNLYDEGVASPLYIYFKFNDNICSDFFEFYFDGGQANRQIKDIVQEGARNHGLLNLSIDDFFNIKIRMPNLNEQQKIAEVMTACDGEINLLNLKLENLKKQKQGLMQKLLSGKVKVK